MLDYPLSIIYLLNFCQTTQDTLLFISHDVRLYSPYDLRLNFPDDIISTSP